MVGFWGSARSLFAFTTSITTNNIEVGCNACDCYETGSIRTSLFEKSFSSLECRKTDGQCECQPHVNGRRCNECEVI